MDGTKALGTLEDSVCVLRFVKPSYESNVTGLHHELARRTTNNAIQKQLRDAVRLQVGFVVLRFDSLSKF